MLEQNPKLNMQTFWARQPVPAMVPMVQAKPQIQISDTELLERTAYTSQELRSAIGLIANRLGISALVARRLLYQMAGTGQIRSNYSELRRFFTEHLADRPAVLREEFSHFNEAKAVRPQTDQFVRPETMAPRIKSPELLTNLLNDDRSGTHVKHLDGGKHSDAELRQLLSTLVKSPQAFASLLVNNKSAFILLRANPQLALMLIAMTNGETSQLQSPIFFSEIAKLLAQLLKLKQGKSVTEDIEEGAVEDREHEVIHNDAEHQSMIVNTVKETIEALPIRPLKDFLLEAERFAEEEVANLWSLTLKREKELEAKILDKWGQFRKKK